MSTCPCHTRGELRAVRTLKGRCATALEQCSTARTHRSRAVADGSEVSLVALSLAEAAEDHAAGDEALGEDEQ
ncbi:MAG: hypothetical protein IIB58_07955 [Planctomycetes bacterium]|nr:hypothetical protein [Planctomycetota bacterium]